MIRVVIADDDALVRAGLDAILSSSPQIEVVGQAPDGVEAIRTCRELRPDLAVLDIAMPRCGGLEAATRIRAEQPQCAIVLVTTVDQDDQVRTALDRGFSFVLKASSPDELIRAVLVAADTVYISPRITSRLVEQTLRATPQPGLDDLTTRERQVLALLAAGESNYGIGRRLHLSEGTVKVHVKAILRKLDVDNRVKAAVIAHRAGLV